MKRFYSKLLSFFVICFLIVGCSKKEVEKPESVVQQYLNALSVGDLNTAAKLVNIPQEMENSPYYQSQIFTEINKDKVDIDEKGSIQDIAINDVMTLFTNGNVTNGQPEFIKRDHADKGTIAIVKAMITFKDGSYHEVIYPLKHTGDAYRIIFSDIPIR